MSRSNGYSRTVDGEMNSGQRKGSHPIQNGSHPIQNGSHPIRKGSHPIQNGSHPIHNGNHPIQNGNHPIPNGNHPIHNGTSKVKATVHTNGVLKKNGFNGTIQNNIPANGTKDISFLKSLSDIIFKEALEKGLDSQSKVVDFHYPRELQSLLDLELDDDPTADSTLLKICRQVIQYSVKSGHENFYNQLFGGMNIHGLAGSWLTESLNTSQYTYEVAPVFTLMEREVFKKMRSLIGFTSGDGIFCPGGSMSNMYAISLSRYRLFPEIKAKGMQAVPPLCILTSEQSHYSWKKGAAFLGIGMDNVIQVKCDDKGKMIPTDLEKTIDDVTQQGLTPLLVIATAGTTVLGAYDPIDEIANICERYGIWLHVDGAWGGSVLLSQKHKHLMNGIHRADSMTWNPHKMMGALFQCSAFLTRHEKLLDQCHSAKASYLFQQDKFYDVSFDTGDKSVQCGRKVDVLKLWLMWKAKGNVRFETDINNIFNCARYLTQKIGQTEGFRLVLAEPECTNVCFWYIPPRLQGQSETPEWWSEVGKVAPQIKERMVKEGTVLVGYQPLGDKVNFFRMVIANLQVTTANMDHVVKEVQRLGADL